MSAGTSGIVFSTETEDPVRLLLFKYSNVPIIIYTPMGRTVSNYGTVISVVFEKRIFRGTIVSLSKKKTSS